jgi:hypothetical protein
MRWQYLTSKEQQKIKNAKPIRKKPIKKKLDINAIKVTLPPPQEKLFSGKDWMKNVLAFHGNKK